MTTSDSVTKAIVDLHDFFSAWFNGTVARNQLEPLFLSHLDEQFMFIPPEGQVMSGNMLKDGFEIGYGRNPNLRIQIRNVNVRHVVGKTVLATYTEWQAGTQDPGMTNARISSALIDTSQSLSWLHLHETWLPESAHLVDSFDF